MAGDEQSNPTSDTNRGPKPPGTDSRDEAIRQALAALGTESRAERRAKQIVPWIGTVGFHAGIILLGFLVTWSVVLFQSEDEPVQIVADFHAMNYEPVVELNPDADEFEELNPTQDDLSLLEFDDPLPDPFRDQAVEQLAAAPNPVAPPSLDFTTTTVEGSASFMGVSASNAQRIAYVIDASGSMIAHLQFILHELERSLDALTEEQSFGIVFFQRNEALAVPPGRRLIAARPSEKSRALDWIDDNVIPSGRSNPIPALEQALRMQPDVIFILSVNITGAGHYEVDQRDLLARLDQLNPQNPSSGQRRTQINCIQFIHPDPLDTMKLIAQEHGGENGYKFLSLQELMHVR